MQENQWLNVSQLLLSPSHHHKQTVLRFPRNFWDISSHMVHTPFSKPPFRLLHASVSLFFQLAPFFFFYTEHKHILGFWRCVSSQPITVRSCCVSQPMKEEQGWSHQEICTSCFSLYPISFFYHLPLTLSFALFPSLLIYYTNEAEVRTWHKQTMNCSYWEGPHHPHLHILMTVIE